MPKRPSRFVSPAKVTADEGETTPRPLVLLQAQSLRPIRPSKRGDQPGGDRERRARPGPRSRPDGFEVLSHTYPFMKRADYEKFYLPLNPSGFLAPGRRRSARPGRGKPCPSRLPL